MKLGAGGKLGCDSQQGFVEEADRHAAERGFILVASSSPQAPRIS